MIIDFRASCGNDIKQARVWRLSELDHWAERCGIDMMVLESADARVHPIDEAAHERLLAECAASGGRFLPALSLNVKSDRHAVERVRTARRRGFVCIVSDGEWFEESHVLHAILEALEPAPLPLYRVLTYGEMDLAYRVALRHPGLKFVFEVRGYASLELNHRLMHLPNVYLSIARTLICESQLERACREMGAHRVLLAGDLPYQHPGRPLGIVADADLSEADKDMVRGGSAAGLLAQHGIALPVVTRRTPLLRPNIGIIDAHGHIGSDHQRPDFDYSEEGLRRALKRGGGERIYASNLDSIFGDFAEGNRRTIEALRAHPSWLGGYLVINPKMGEACLAEIRRCRDDGYIGLKPYPYTFGHTLSDPIMDPVYELAERMGLCVMCHSEHNDLRRVLEKHPKLRMLAAHMSGEPLEKAALAREFPHTVLEISGAGSAPEDVERAVAIAGAEKMVFGSDLNAHPLGWTLFPLIGSGLPEATIRAVLRENALRFFGLA